MKIPEELKNNLEEITNKYKQNELKNVYANISERYMNEKRTGNTLLSSEIDVIAYANARMPATYSAVNIAFSQIIDYINKENIKTLLDIGAGTGAATWGISDYISFEEITCIEREQNMLDFGKKLMKNTKLERFSYMENARYNKRGFKRKS